MSILFEAAEPLSQLIEAHFNRFDEDSIDRVNHKWSTIIFCILAIMITANNYVGEIIKCWAPHQFAEHWVEYTNSICWISNTYFVPMSTHDIIESPRHEIGYYQWVALVLFGQAIAFYVPSFFWAFFARGVGMDINKIVKTLRQADTLNPEVRDGFSTFIAKHMDKTLNSTRQYRTGACSKVKEKLAAAGCFCGKRQGNYLIVIYLITKLLYMVDTLGQMYLMHIFLGTDYMFYGLEVIRDLISDGDFKESRRFPRVTLCDFQIRVVGKTQQHTVQCALPVNLFNEKIFVFVWFWLAMLTTLNFLGFCYWVWIAFTTNRRSYIKKFLKTHGIYNKETDHELLGYFCSRYLRQDGHFVLRMISKNTSDVVVGELVKSLWKFYREEMGKKKRKLHV